MESFTRCSNGNGCGNGNASKPPANEVWGKVIFCIFLSFCSQGGRGGGIPACIAGGIPASLAAGLQGRGGIRACLAGFQSHSQGGSSGGFAWWGASRPTPKGTATAGDGTHPTGMHSCYYYYCRVVRTLSTAMQSKTQKNPLLSPNRVNGPLHMMEPWYSSIIPGL